MFITFFRIDCKVTQNEVSINSVIARFLFDFFLNRLIGILGSLLWKRNITDQDWVVNRLVVCMLESDVFQHTFGCLVGKDLFITSLTLDIILGFLLLKMHVKVAMLKNIVKWSASWRILEWNDLLVRFLRKWNIRFSIIMLFFLSS